MSALGGPSLAVLSPLGLPQSPRGILQAGPCPHCSQGSQRLVPKSLSWHTCPPLILRSLGQAPSPHSSEILEIGSLPPSGIILPGTPEDPCPYFSRYPQTSSPPNGGRSIQPPLHKDLQPQVLTGAPAQPTSPVIAHRDPARQTPNTFPPQSPRVQAETPLRDLSHSS